MLRGSQGCSALRGLRPLGLAFGHPSAALGHWPFGPKAAKPPCRSPPIGPNLSPKKALTNSLVEIAGKSLKKLYF